MLLRSSSTPVLGSLLSSFPESPNNLNHCETNITIKHPPTAIPQSHHKLSLRQNGSLSLSSFSRNSSPISPSIPDLDRSRGFQRAQSEGNLEGLAFASYNSNDQEPNKVLDRPKCCVLQTISSIRGGREDVEGGGEEERDTEDDGEREELSQRNERGEERAMSMEAQTLSLENRRRNMVWTEEATDVMNGIWSLGFGGEKELLGQGMFLAGGLGVGGGGDGVGGGGESNSAGPDGDGGDNREVEEYYKRMVEENPGNPLFLRNYAQFLYEWRRDLQGAEQYYARAILADPKDGEVLSQYAKLVWECNHDQDRASTYFERAVQASPQDSHVHAAYASFLWETEEDEDESDVPKESEVMLMPSHFHGAVASASA
ncbi:hypothetical protein F2P56_023372 [Juglans regia]|uniref:Uncharacterized protein LOC108981222 n=2 Tax=Juglans regia TaxID=51240 RepID=A0A2I4DL43_JUGRE|nr:uncharacterized protein LOC108981222 [Juglans regia]XP_018807875.2 uncharacterized protein LOC108981222 [Juglans regia]KAF5459425.1 hypothetical protein F2P56_023372 [Juglans regia]